MCKMVTLRIYSCMIDVHALDILEIVILSHSPASLRKKKACPYIIINEPLFHAQNSALFLFLMGATT